MRSEKKKKGVSLGITQKPSDQSSYFSWETTYVNILLPGCSGTYLHESLLE